MSFIFYFPFFILMQSFFSKQEEYISEKSKETYYKFSIFLPPNNWIVFIDTFNEYLILYDPVFGEEWPKQILNSTFNLTKGEEQIINNYQRQLNATVYTSPVANKNSNNSVNLSYYYTKDIYRDYNVWNNIPINSRQLSLGIGLNVKNENFSFIYLLYKKGYISQKCFSFYHEKNTINLGPIPRQMLLKYPYKFKIIVPVNENHWGFNINTLTINRIEINIGKFAVINSGLKELVVSKDLYLAFKNFFFSNDNYRDICIEKKRIECNITKEQMNETVFLNIGDNIVVNISLFSLFKCYNQNCIFDKVINDDTPITQVGYSFLKLFNFIEFDFESRSIAFFSSNRTLFTKSNSPNYKKEMKTIIYILSIFQIFLIILVVILKNFILNKNKIVGNYRK